MLNLTGIVSPIYLTAFHRSPHFYQKHASDRIRLFQPSFIHLHTRTSHWSAKSVRHYCDLCGVNEARLNASQRALLRALLTRV